MKYGGARDGGLENEGRMKSVPMKYEDTSTGTVIYKWNVCVCLSSFDVRVLLLK